MFLHIKQLKHVLVISGLFCTVIAEGRNFGRVIRAAAFSRRLVYCKKGVQPMFYPTFCLSVRHFSNHQDSIKKETTSSSEERLPDLEPLMSFIPKWSMPGSPSFFDCFLDMLATFSGLF